MMHVRRGHVALIAAAILLVAVLPMIAVKAQPVGQLQPGFSQALSAVQQAESAGATPSETVSLATLLNQALALSQEAVRLTGPHDAERQTDLLSQANQILVEVQAGASQLESFAAQRAFTGKVVAYISGAVGAVLGTLGYAFGGFFYRKYRIKRTFQMRISPK